MLINSFGHNFIPSKLFKRLLPKYVPFLWCRTLKKPEKIYFWIFCYKSFCTMFLWCLCIISIQIWVYLGKSTDFWFLKSLRWTFSTNFGTAYAPLDFFEIICPRGKKTRRIRFRWERLRIVSEKIIIHWFLQFLEIFGVLWLKTFFVWIQMY